jgi:hypothetical protein
MDSREAFEAINVIPDNAEFCEKHQMYKVKQYRGIITHPVNKQWESFQEGAEWQASRQAVESEAVAWLWVVNGHRATVPKDYADELIEDGETVLPLYTHPASADVPEKWRTVMKELADDLESEVEARRSGDLDRRIERDLIVVKEARVLLDEQEQGQ